MSSLSIFVATHRAYSFPSDPAYQPIQVGKALSSLDLGILGDDTGDSISDRNPYYCELTGLYWAWRNVLVEDSEPAMGQYRDAEVSGLVHYRRYFGGSRRGQIASGADMSAWVEKADMVVAAPRRYFIETVRSHYARAHHESDLDTARDVIAEQCPEYLGAFDRVMAQRHLSLYNMMVARKEILDSYCSWLFPVLDECYQRIPLDTYGPQQRRAIGYLGERLLNVWVAHHSGTIRVARRKVVSLERESALRKAFGLIRRRMGHGRAE